MNTETLTAPLRAVGSPPSGPGLRPRWKPGQEAAPEARSVLRSALSAPRRKPASCAFVAPWLIMLAALWGPVVYLLGAQWSFFQQYNYGWAVPLLCIYLAWERWQSGQVGGQKTEDRGQKTEDRRRRAEGGGRNRGEIEHRTSNIELPTSNGSEVGGQKSDFSFQLSEVSFRRSAVWLLIVCGVLLWVTRVLQEANPIWRAASYGLAMEAVAITLLLLYLTGGKSRAKHFAFPIVFFLVAVPWPTPVEGAVIQNLTRLNAAAVVELLNAFGIPALLRGNVIEVSTGVVGIDEACSGIRSVQATLMVSLFFGEFYRLRFVPRLAMVVGGLGSALLFNMARMFLLTWVASRDGTQAIEKWYDPAGVTILVACFLFLWGLGAWLGKQASGAEPTARSGARSKEQGGEEPRNIEHPTSNIEHPTSNGAGDTERRAEIGGQKSEATGSARVSPGWSSHPKSEDRSQRPEVSDPTSDLRPLTSSLPSPTSHLWHLACAVAVWVVMVEVSTEVWFRSHEVRGVEAISWSVRWPDRNPTFESKTFPSTVSDMLKYDEGVSGAWVEADRSGWQAFYLRWLPGRSFYGRMRVALAKSHNPEICLQAGGLSLRMELEPVIVQVQPGFSLAFRRYVFDAGGKPLHVFFSGTEDVQVTGASGFLRMTHRERLQAALAGSRNFGQRNFEVAISGFDDPGQALRLFEEKLPGLVQVGEPR